LKPGIGVITRSNAWIIDERTVASVSNGRLYLTEPTSTQFESGWGYLLTGALWMLDSPGEWHYNPTNESLYVWLPDGGAPGDRVSMGFGERAVDASGTSHVVIRDIAARRAIDGIVI